MIFKYFRNGKKIEEKKSSPEEMERLQEQYEKTHPVAHRGISGCCDSALNPVAPNNLGE